MGSSCICTARKCLRGVCLRAVRADASLVRHAAERSWTPPQSVRTTVLYWLEFSSTTAAKWRNGTQVGRL